MTNKTLISNTLGRNHRGRALRIKNGFTLVPIILLGIFGISMIMALLPLVDNVFRNESSNKIDADLRNNAEVGIDYALQKLNTARTEGKIPADLSEDLPSVYLSNPAQTLVQVRSYPIDENEWNSINCDVAMQPKPNSSSRLFIKDWKVIESVASRGLFSRTIRVFAAPNTNRAVGDPSTNSSSGGISSYFKNALSASDLTIGSRGKVSALTGKLTAQVVEHFNLEPQSTYTGDYSAGTPNFAPSSTVIGDKVPADLTVSAPLPFVNNATPLWQTASATRLEGVYATPSFTATQPVQIPRNDLSPLKIIVSDNMLPTASNNPPPAVDLHSKSIQNVQNQALQIWYDGDRPINILLESNMDALIYAPLSTITITSTNNENTFTGAIVGRTVVLGPDTNIKINTDVQTSNKSNSGAGLLRQNGATSDEQISGYQVANWQEFAGRPRHQSY